MSITRLAVLGAETQKLRTEVKADVVNASRSVETALDKIAVFIPSEVIGIYVAGVGILAPQSFKARWLIFVICVLLIPLIMWFAYALAIKKKQLPLPGKKILGVQFLLAFVAFAAWACAMPDTPFLSMWANATQIGGFAAIILAYVMPKLAELFDIVPWKG